jgi:hypothetical protein
MASDADAIILEPRSMLSFGERERAHNAVFRGMGKQK